MKGLLAMIIPTEQQIDNPALELWEHIFTDLSGYLCIASLNRDTGKMSQRFFLYPENAEQAQEYALKESGRGQEAYFCAHLLEKRGDKVKRQKGYAASVRALWADGDGA